MQEAGKGNDGPDEIRHDHILGHEKDADSGKGSKAVLGKKHGTIGPSGVRCARIVDDQRTNQRPQRVGQGREAGKETT